MNREIQIKILFHLFGTLTTLAIILSVIEFFSALEMSDTINFYKDNRATDAKQLLLIWEKDVQFSYAYSIGFMVVGLFLAWRWNILRKKLNTKLIFILLSIIGYILISFFLLLIFFIITFPRIPIGQG